MPFDPARLLLMGEFCNHLHLHPTPYLTYLLAHLDFREPRCIPHSFLSERSRPSSVASDCTTFPTWASLLLFFFCRSLLRHPPLSCQLDCRPVSHFPRGTSTVHFIFHGSTISPCLTGPLSDPVILFLSFTLHTCNVDQMLYIVG